MFSDDSRTPGGCPSSAARRSVIGGAAGGAEAGGHAGPPAKLNRKDFRFVRSTVRVTGVAYIGHRLARRA